MQLSFEHMWGLWVLLGVGVALAAAQDFHHRWYSTEGWMVKIENKVESICSKTSES